MESENVYIIVRESVSRGFSSILLSSCFYEAFSDAAERMKKMLSDEKKRFSDKAEVFSGNTQCGISEGPAHSVTLRIKKIEKYRKAQRKAQAQYQAVDLGLPSGLKWSDRNVGAASPQDYGDYFMWGSVTPDTCNVCDWAHAPFNNGLEYFDEEYFNANSGTWLTDEGTLKLGYDAAHKIMGGSWRMPTSEEMQELLDGTTRSVEELNGVKGMRFTAPNGNSIFIPFAGHRDGSYVDFVGLGCYVWSSSLFEGYAYNSHGLIFGDNGDADVSSGGRYFGFVVRGVCA